MNRGKLYITRLDFYDGKDRENKNIRHVIGWYNVPFHLLSRFLFRFQKFRKVI